MDFSSFSRFAKIYEKGDVIFSEFEKGDTFYLIQSGQVQLVKIVNGIEKNLDILKASEIFGEMAILENSPRSATAIALDQVKVLEFNKENFEVLMTGNPAIAMKLLKLFVKRIYTQKLRFMVLTLGYLQARVGDVFIMLYQTMQTSGHGETVFIMLYQTMQTSGHGETVEIAVTKEDVAHWAGLPVDIVQDELNKFVDQRKIEIYEDRIIVKNIIELERFVNSKRRKSLN